MKKMELLAPAGTMEKMKMALLYGADAVYLAGKVFGLRAYGGIKMAEQACTTYGYQPSAELHKIFTDYTRTHNQAVFEKIVIDGRGGKKSVKVI